MTENVCRNLRRALVLFAAVTCFSLSAQAQLTSPSQEELKMTSLPEVPGAPAVYLERELLIDDGIQVYGAHVRIKVLTEEGKKYAEVELPRVPEGKSFTVTDLQARTIHADGSIVAFAGQPTDKATPNGTVKVITLPDVQVGSIVEYRYKLAMPMQSPVSAWILQSELYTRKMHYIWRLSGNDFYKLNRAPVEGAPADDAGSGGGRGGRGGGGGGGGAAPPKEGEIQALAWASYLPQGAEVKQSILPGGMGMVSTAGMRTVELTAKDIMPAPVEKDAPPVESMLYRVLFYYSGYPEAPVFWKVQGADWSKKEDAFINGDTLKSTALGMVSGSDTEDMKLKKLYAAVMTVNNTDYSKAVAGAASPTSAEQVWEQKTGDSGQITDLFVGLARAVGFKAYLMAVPSRTHGVFLPDYLSFGQFQDKVAIVNIGGKEQFFDPGSRYCAYGHLAWQHAAVRGIRQIEGEGTNITEQTPGEPYAASKTNRVADLTLAADGTVSGPVTFVFTGAPALEWREKALGTDDAGIRAQMKSWLQGMLPGGMDVQPPVIEKLTDSEQPLKVQFQVRGKLGAVNGKKIQLPADFFLAAAKPTFTAEKRMLPIDFHYSSMLHDATRVKFPAGFSVESSPSADKEQYLKSSEFTLSAAAAPGSVTVQRELVMVDVIIPASEYGAFRTYYNQVEQKSQQNIVINAPAGGN